MSQPPYPQPSESGSQQPDYQNAPAPPTGYGVSGGMPPPPPGSGVPAPQAVGRPTTVTYAIYALVANLVLGLLTTILIFANKDAYLDQALEDAGLDSSSASAADVANTAYSIGAVVGLIFVALWALVIWFAWKGYNWARIVIWVLGGLSLISVLGTFSSPVGLLVFVNVLALLLTAAAVVLLALKPSNEWFRYQGDARRHGWPTGT